MILITGAGGTVGSALVDAMRAGGHDFRAGYYSAEKLERAAQSGIDAARIDFSEPATLMPALDGIETVFLLGSGVGGQIERETNVVRAARTAGARRIVKLSAWGASREQYAIAGMHRGIERVIEGSGLAWTFLRPNTFMQNFCNYMAGTIKTQGRIYQTAADARISFIDARDIAAAAVVVLTTAGHDHSAYELSGPTSLSYHQTARILSDVLERQIEYVALPDDVARTGMLDSGMPDFYADAMIDLGRAYRDGVGSPVTRDLERITGRSPIAFEQFARDHADRFR